MPSINFNANEVEPSAAFDPIPAGKYIAVISDSEFKQTRSGNGRYLQLEFVIVEGEFAKRKIWARLNIENPNPDAVRIARADLSAICRAVNVLAPKDTVELHNIPLEITVRCKRNADDEIVNEIKGFAARQQRAAASASPAQSQRPAWMRAKQ